MGRGHEQSRHGRRNSFVLPMFCRLSIKDVRFSHTEDRADDPSSPKVSCMGQVRRKNRVTGSSAATGTNNINQHSHNYTKLITIFSSRNLVPPTNTNNASVYSGSRRSGSKSCRTSREMISVSNLRITRLKKYNHDDFGDPDSVEAVADVGEMDPPLPVMKRATPPGGGGDEVNIWKRRFNGAALQSLQIDQINLSKSRFLPPTTV
ncbi:uncharacterized protein LOC142534077 [Primulina tabacum]|uniref:uncharacterized protein LOC142534077 n=1 Tax=Primulina tabacum TaxID=48773 RepID=UPI003F5A55BB